MLNSETYDTPSITSTLKKVVPNVRIVVITSKTMNSKDFDFDSYPAALNEYRSWFPMVLYIPGEVWDRANEHLGPDNYVDISDGVRVMNAEHKDGRPVFNRTHPDQKRGALKHKYTHDYRKLEHWEQWLQECVSGLVRDDFQSDSEKRIEELTRENDTLRKLLTDQLLVRADSSDSRDNGVPRVKSNASRRCIII